MLGNSTGNRAIFLQNASLEIRWDIRKIIGELKLNKSIYVAVGGYVGE
jgi:hypothetical protein